MKKKIIPSLIIITMFYACNKKIKVLCDEINFVTVDSITLVNSTNKNIDLTDNTSFLSDFHELELIDGIWKFRGRMILIKKASIVDTIFTNGTVFQYHDRYYRSKDGRNILKGLIQECPINETIVIDKLNVSD